MAVPPSRAGPDPAKTFEKRPLFCIADLYRRDFHRRQKASLSVATPRKAFTHRPDISKRNGAISNATPLNTTDQLHQSRNCWVQGSGGAWVQRGKSPPLCTPAPPPVCSPSLCVGVSVAKSG